MKKLLALLLLLSSIASAENVNNTAWENIGTVPSALQEINGGTITVRELGNIAQHKTVLRLVATPVTVTNNAGVALYGGIQLYTFPVGNILIKGAEIQTFGAAALTCSSAGLATFTSVTSLGTVTAANDATLTSAEANILASAASSAAVAKVATIKNITLTAPTAPLDGTLTAIPLFLNIDIANDAANATGSCTFTGFITINWESLSFR